MKFTGTKTNPSRLGFWLLGGASATALMAIGMTPALAQQVAAAPATETVVVTGTLIKGINPVGTNIVSVSSAQIQANGMNTVDRILEEMPQVSNLFNAVPTSGSNDLGVSRGVSPGIHAGAGSTLQLINGHNIVGVGVLQTTGDAAEIPSFVLQRVDVVADGGSALYGADAVAGTVNLLTRKTFDGFEAQASYGSTGNYTTDTFAAIAGESWGSGNAYVAYQYTYNSFQYSYDRPYPRQYLPTLVGAGAQDLQIFQCPLANIAVGANNFALNTNTLSTTPGSIKTAVTAGTRNACDVNALNGPGSVGDAQGVAVIPTEQQHTFWGTLTQHIADGIDLTVTANYFTHTATGLAASRVGSGTITNANPYFQPIGTETSQNVTFDWSPAFGPYNRSPETESKYEIVPDLNIELGDWENFKNWSLDIMGNYGRSLVTTQRFDINTVAVNSFLASTNIATALDPYNLNATNTQTLTTIQNYGQWSKGVQQLVQLQMLAQGTIWSLPGGDVSLAVGARYEHYKTIGALLMGTTGSQLNGVVIAPLGGFYNTSTGHRITQSVYGEMQIPIVGDGNELPFVHALSLDISGRYDHLATSAGAFVGGTNNFRLSGTYSPIAGLNIRGNMGTSFVAPGLDDTVTAVDTRVNFSATSGADPFDSAAAQALERVRPSYLIAGGNRFLQPQKGVTSSYGFDYTPDFIDGLTLSLTRWKVNVHSALSLPGIAAATLQFDPAGGVVAAAYAPYILLNPTLAQLIAYTNVNGVPITQNGFSGYASSYANGAANTPYRVTDARRYNFGTTQASGWDFNVNYVMQTDFGSVNASVNGTDYTRRLTVLPTSSSDNLAFNTAPYQMTGAVGATWGALTGRIAMQYSAGFSVNGATTATFTQTHADAFMPVNLFLSYNLNDLSSWTSGATVSLNVNNLADDIPALINSGSGVTNGQTLGRYWQFTLRKTF